MNLSLDQLRRLAFPPDDEWQRPAVPETKTELVNAVSVHGAKALLAVLPPHIAAILGFANEAAAAVAKLSDGDPSQWINLIQQAQTRWVDYINGQWDIPQRCRDQLRRDAASRYPEPEKLGGVGPWIIPPLSVVPLKESCGKGNPPPGKYGWKPLGVGKTIYGWGPTLPGYAGTGKQRQTWIPDPRQSLADGYCFCPATFPYCIPHQMPWTWDEGVVAIMAARYQDLVTNAATSDQDLLDAIFHRLMAIINAGKVVAPGQPFEHADPVRVVQTIPDNVDPSQVYVTPSGELWASTKTRKIRSSWNTDLAIMEATVGQLQQMLASLGGIKLIYALNAPGDSGGGAPKGPGGEGGQGGGGGGGGGMGGQGPGGLDSGETSGGGLIVSLGAIALAGGATAYALRQRGKGRGRRQARSTRRRR